MSIFGVGMLPAGLTKEQWDEIVAECVARDKEARDFADREGYVTGRQWRENNRKKK